VKPIMITVCMMGFTHPTGIATVTFSTPGSSPIIVYTATCSAAVQATRTAGSASSPITVLALTGGVSYSCMVATTNTTGTGAPSLALPVVPQEINPA
jgi:hypothetical protein